MRFGWSARYRTGAGRSPVSAPAAVPGRRALLLDRKLFLASHAIAVGFVLDNGQDVRIVGRGVNLDLAAKRREAERGGELRPARRFKQLP